MQLDEREELTFLEADVRLEESAGALQGFSFDLPVGEAQTQPSRQRVQPRMVEQRTYELLRGRRSGLLEQEREQVFLFVAKLRHSRAVEEGEEVTPRCTQSFSVTGCRTGAACDDEGTVVMVRERDEHRVPSHGNLRSRGLVAIDPHVWLSPLWLAGRSGCG